MYFKKLTTVSIITLLILMTIPQQAYAAPVFAFPGAQMTFHATQNRSSSGVYADYFNAHSSSIYYTMRVQSAGATSATIVYSANGQQSDTYSIVYSQPSPTISNQGQQLYVGGLALLYFSFSLSSNPDVQKIAQLSSATIAFLGKPDYVPPTDITNQLRSVVDNNIQVTASTLPPDMQNIVHDTKTSSTTLQVVSQSLGIILVNTTVKITGPNFQATGVASDYYHTNSGLLLKSDWLGMVQYQSSGGNTSVTTHITGVLTQTNIPLQTATVTTSTSVSQPNLPWMVPGNFVVYQVTENASLQITIVSVQDSTLTLREDSISDRGEHSSILLTVNKSFGEFFDARSQGGSSELLSINGKTYQTLRFTTQDSDFTDTWWVETSTRIILKYMAKSNSYPSNVQTLTLQSTNIPIPTVASSTTTQSASTITVNQINLFTVGNVLFHTTQSSLQVSASLTTQGVHIVIPSYSMSLYANNNKIGTLTVDMTADANPDPGYSGDVILVATSNLALQVDSLTPFKKQFTYQVDLSQKFSDLANAVKNKVLPKITDALASAGIIDQFFITIQPDLLKAWLSPIFQGDIGTTIITSASPANLLVTSPSGKQIGTTLQGQSVNQVSGAYYSGPNTEPQVVWIQQSEKGVYNVTLIPTGTGIVTYGSGVYTQTLITSANQVTVTLGKPVPLTLNTAATTPQITQATSVQTAQTTQSVQTQNTPTQKESQTDNTFLWVGATSVFVALVGIGAYVIGTRKRAGSKS